MLSILTPAYHEAANLDGLYARLSSTMAGLGIDWEWLIVDDHSRDETFGVVSRLATLDRRVHGIRLARNVGSHAAIRCGLHYVQGDAVVMMAGDLQDPPETLGKMVAEWQSGSQVVWAVRRTQPGTAAHSGFATLYYWIMRRVVGMKDMPATGADFFLIDRVVIDALRSCPERNASVFALITWLGFNQAQVPYEKQPRAAGVSGWTLARKIGLVVDSVIGFSDLPVRLCSYTGGGLLVLGVVAGLVSVASRPAGLTWLAPLMLVLTGLQLLGLGIVGEYVARALAEARGRPGYVIEARTKSADAAAMT